MSKVRNSKASDPSSSQKSGGHYQENNKSSNHTALSDATSKSGMQMESQESEVKQIVLPTMEKKSPKIATKSSKRIAEANEKKESQMNAENGVHKSKNKKTENGDHSDKKSDKLDFNNGLVEGTSHDESENIKLEIEDEVQLIEIVNDNEAQSKPKANSNSQEKEEQMSNKSVEMENINKESDVETTIPIDSQDSQKQLNESQGKDELMNGDQSVSEQSFQNLSFGRTLRKITGRPSLGRMTDRHESMNSSMFVNTSFMSSLNDENLEVKYSHIRNSLSGLKRKANDEIETSPKSKRIKSESNSTGYSFFPIRYFSSFRRSDESVEIEKNVIGNDSPPESSKSKCLVM